MIDLHSHSLFSDGSERPARVVELAKMAGCRAMSLTDHDGLDGLEEAAKRAGELGIELVRGCEVSCAFEGRALHVLCYFVEDGEIALHEELVRLQEDRTRRNALMIERLQSLGLSIDLEEVHEKAEGRGVGRPHMAAVLVDHGVVSDINEAFDRYLGKGRPGYVPKARVTIETIIDLARRSFGVAVVAHPLSLGLSDAKLDAALDSWAGSGLVGLESYYSRYDQETRTKLVRTARRHELVPTGGSDFHGSYKPGLFMGTGTGDLVVPDDVLEELRSRAERGE